MMSAGWDPWELGLGSSGRDDQRAQCRGGEDCFIDPSRIAELP